MAEDLSTFQADLPENAGANSPAPAEAPGRFAGAKLPALTKSSVMLGIMFIGGVLGVYLIGLRVSPQMVSAEELIADQEVESVLLQYHTSLRSAGNLRKRETAILDTFYYEAGNRQIPLDALQGNPFVFRASAFMPVAEGNKDNAASTATSSRSLDDMAVVKQLKLQSVMMSGKQSAVIISNNLLTEGQTIRGWIVLKISPHHVELRRKDKTYILEMPR